MSYNRAKPLGSGMLKKDFKGENDGGCEQQLLNWESRRVDNHLRILNNTRIRIAKLVKKKIQHDRNRIQGDANGAS